MIAVAAPGGLDDLLRLVRAGNVDLDATETEAGWSPVDLEERPTGEEPWIEEHDLD